MKTLFGIALVVSLLAPAPARADGRSVAYLQGVAFGIAANCPNLPLDIKAIALSKQGIPGLRRGTPTEFVEGVFQYHAILNGMASGDELRTCKDVCLIARPGTCYFVKEPEEREPK